MFAEALNKHEEYSLKCFEKNGELSNYDTEIGHKIRQLDWLIARATLLYTAVLNNRNPDNEIFLESLYELEIVTESFYYFVGRLVALFKRNPNFGNIPKSDAEMIRHQLLQHPENVKVNEKSQPSITVGSEDGPKLKAYFGPEDSFYDKGLFLNAREFNEKLVIVFNKKANNA